MYNLDEKNNIFLFFNGTSKLAMEIEIKIDVNLDTLLRVYCHVDTSTGHYTIRLSMKNQSFYICSVWFREYQFALIGFNHQIEKTCLNFITDQSAHRNNMLFQVLVVIMPWHYPILRRLNAIIMQHNGHWISSKSQL